MTERYRNIFGSGNECKYEECVDEGNADMESMRNWRQCQLCSYVRGASKEGVRKVQ